MSIIDWKHHTTTVKRQRGFSISLRKTTLIPYKVVGGLYKSTASFLLDKWSDMTVFCRVVSSADWLADLVRFGLIIFITQRWSKERGVKKKKKPNKNEWVWRGASFLQEPTTLAEGRMLENKRERLKTFLRKIDEKAVIRIKHFMKERWGDECC